MVSTVRSYSSGPGCGTEAGRKTGGGESHAGAAPISHAIGGAVLGRRKSNVRAGGKRQGCGSARTDSIVAASAAASAQYGRFTAACREQRRRRASRGANCADL